MTTVLTEQLHAGSFIVSEKDGFYSRDAVAVDASAALAAGTVLGIKGIPADETASASAVPGNTGNGTLAMDGTAPIAASAKDGIYQVIMLTATTFQVEDPNGNIVGEGANGAAFNNQIKFVVTAGGTAFVAGDRFAIQVNRADPSADQFEPLNLSATDGTQIAAAVLIYPIVATEVAAGTTIQKAVLRRVAEVRLSDLTWPAGITATQLLEAQNQLRSVGIVCR